MSSRDRNFELRTLALALVATLLVWNAPYGNYVLYPFKLLATWLHELSHGLMMMLTGAGFDYVLIYRDTSGLAYAHSKVGPFGTGIIAAAGYMGTPLWGAVLLVATPSAKAAQRALVVLGLLCVASAFTVIAARPDDPFGPWAVGAMGGAFVLLAFLPGAWRMWAAHLIAVQSCINALLDIRVLLRPTQVVDGQFAGQSDAHNMAAVTFGTTDTWAVHVWAGIWIVWSLLVLFVALRWTGRFNEWLASKRARKTSRATASPRDESDRGERRRSPGTAPDRTAPSAPADTEAP